MKRLTNSVNLIGRLGAAPELKELDGGNKLARITMATNEYFKDAKGEKVEKTEWHNLIAWNALADNMNKLLDKGDQLAIEGKITTKHWEDTDGNKRYSTEIVVNEFLKLSPKA